MTTWEARIALFALFRDVVIPWFVVPASGFAIGLIITLGLVDMLDGERYII